MVLEVHSAELSATRWANDSAVDPGRTQTVVAGLLHALGARGRQAAGGGAPAGGTLLAAAGGQKAAEARCDPARCDPIPMAVG